MGRGRKRYISQLPLRKVTIRNTIKGLQLRRVKSSIPIELPMTEKSPGVPLFCFFTNITTSILFHYDNYNTDVGTPNNPRLPYIHKAQHD